MFYSTWINFPRFCNSLNLHQNFLAINKNQSEANYSIITGGLAELVGRLTKCPVLHIPVPYFQIVNIADVICKICSYGFDENMINS